MECEERASRATSQGFRGGSTAKAAARARPLFLDLLQFIAQDRGELVVFLLDRAGEACAEF